MNYFSNICSGEDSGISKQLYAFDEENKTEQILSDPSFDPIDVPIKDANLTYKGFRWRRSMLICPFCGGEVRILCCDDEGNIHDDGYASNPWSGLGYVLVHEESDVPANMDCPIATYDADFSHLGTYLYDSIEEAYKAWI